MGKWSFIVSGILGLIFVCGGILLLGGMFLPPRFSSDPVVRIIGGLWLLFGLYRLSLVAFSIRRIKDQRNSQ